MDVGGGAIERGGEEGGLVVIAEEVFVVEVGADGHGGGEELFGEDDLGAEGWAEAAALAAADAVEAVRGGDDPGIFGGAAEVAAEVFENGGVGGRGVDAGGCDDLV